MPKYGTFSLLTEYLEHSRNDPTRNSNGKSFIGISLEEAAWMYLYRTESKIPLIFTTVELKLLEAIEFDATGCVLGDWAKRNGERCVNSLYFATQLMKSSSIERFRNSAPLSVAERTRRCAGESGWSSADDGMGARKEN